MRHPTDNQDKMIQFSRLKGSEKCGADIPVCRTAGRQECLPHIFSECWKPVQVDLSTKSDQELVELQLHENDWYVRHARRLLQERAREPAAPARASEEQSRIAFDHKDPTRRLRALWALHVSGGLGFEEVEKALKDSDPHVRGWTIQLAMERPSANLVMMDKLV